MEIDLMPLHRCAVKEITIHEVISFPRTYLEHSEIRALDDISVEGKIDSLVSSQDHIVLSVAGKMTLADSITLADVNYSFSIEIDQILDESTKKDENTLDLTEFLWENIVLEIPLKFTKVEDLSEFHGDGWKLIHEDEVGSSNNPFADLLKDFGEE